VLSRHRLFAEIVKRFSMMVEQQPRKSGATGFWPAKLKDARRICGAIEEEVAPLRLKYGNMQLVSLIGSSFGVTCNFRAARRGGKRGLLMFTVKYNHGADTFDVDCHMECELRTLTDDDDRVRIIASNPDIGMAQEYARKKMADFLEVYDSNCGN
jgi:hypothetical protein